MIGGGGAYQWTAASITQFENEYGGTKAKGTTPQWPHWDTAIWADGKSGVGTEPNDYIETIIGYPASVGGGKGLAPYGAKRTKSGDSVVNEFGTNVMVKGALRNEVSIHFCRKTMKIDIDELNSLGFDDYNIRTSFRNCIPLSYAGADGFKWAASFNTEKASSSGMWIEKRNKGRGISECTIFVSWAANNYYNQYQGKGQADHPINHRTDVERYAGFLVLTDAMRRKPVLDWKTGFPGGSMTADKIPYGVCIYPSIDFEIIGLTSGVHDNMGSFMSGPSPKLVIR